jgi:hypothetical protein
MTNTERGMHNLGDLVGYSISRAAIVAGSRLRPEDMKDLRGSHNGGSLIQEPQRSAHYSKSFIPLDYTSQYCTQKDPLGPTHNLH